MIHYWLKVECWLTFFKSFGGRFAVEEDDGNIMYFKLTNNFGILFALKDTKYDFNFTHRNTFTEMVFKSRQFLSQNRLYLSIRMESSIFSRSMLINTYDLISMIKCQKHGDKALIKSFLGSQFYEETFFLCIFSFPIHF